MNLSSGTLISIFATAALVGAVSTIVHDQTSVGEPIVTEGPTTEDLRNAEVFTVSRIFITVVSEDAPPKVCQLDAATDVQIAEEGLRIVVHKAKCPALQ